MGNLHDQKQIQKDLYKNTTDHKIQEEQYQQALHMRDVSMEAPDMTINKKRSKTLSEKVKKTSLENTAVNVENMQDIGDTDIESGTTNRILRKNSINVSGMSNTTVKMLKTGDVSGTIEFPSVQKEDIKEEKKEEKSVPSTELENMLDMAYGFYNSILQEEARATGNSNEFMAVVSSLAELAHLKEEGKFAPQDTEIYMNRLCAAEAAANIYFHKNSGFKFTKKGRRRREMMRTIIGDFATFRDTFINGSHPELSGEYNKSYSEQYANVLSLIESSQENTKVSKKKAKTTTKHKEQKKENHINGELSEDLALQIAIQESLENANKEGAVIKDEKKDSNNDSNQVQPATTLSDIVSKHRKRVSLYKPESALNHYQPYKDIDAQLIIIRAEIETERNKTNRENDERLNSLLARKLELEENLSNTKAEFMIMYDEQFKLNNPGYDAEILIEEQKRILTSYQNQARENWEQEKAIKVTTNNTKATKTVNGKVISVNTPIGIQRTQFNNECWAVSLSMQFRTIGINIPPEVIRKFRHKYNLEKLPTESTTNYSRRLGSYSEQHQMLDNNEVYSIKEMSDLIMELTNEYAVKTMEINYNAQVNNIDTVVGHAVNMIRDGLNAGSCVSLLFTGPRHYVTITSIDETNESKPVFKFKHGIKGSTGLSNEKAVGGNNNVEQEWTLTYDKLVEIIQRGSVEIAYFERIEENEIVAPQGFTEENGTLNESKGSNAVEYTNDIEDFGSVTRMDVYPKSKIRKFNNQNN